MPYTSLIRKCASAHSFSYIVKNKVYNKIVGTLVGTTRDVIDVFVDISSISLTGILPRYLPIFIVTVVGL